jgi:hypothetical protein
VSAIDPTPVPLAILIDYDGTICRTAVSDEIMTRLHRPAGVR